MASSEYRGEPDSTEQPSPHTGHSAASGVGTDPRPEHGPGESQADAVGWAVVAIGVLSMLALGGYIVFLLLSVVFDWA